VEEGWRARFGSSVTAALRGALLAQGAPTPWSPPEVHPSDGFFTHVVGRDGPDEEGTERPLVVLLGQALTAASLEHEDGARTSLPLGANFLRLIGRREVRVADVPAMGGISKEAVAMGAGFLQRRGLAQPAPNRGGLLLTPAGLDALTGYEQRAAHHNDQVLREGLLGVLAQSEALSAGLVPLEGGWRGEKPYLSQTQRLLASPTTALPWHPMVLHRGGWPDGS
jgi:hypothetical protein